MIVEIEEPDVIRVTEELTVTLGRIRLSPLYQAANIDLPSLILIETAYE